MATEDSKPTFSNIAGIYSKPDFFSNPDNWGGKNAFYSGVGSSLTPKEFYSSVWSIGDTMNNSAQAGNKGSDANVEAMNQVNQMHNGNMNPLIQAFEAAQKAYEPLGGRKLAGDEDIRIHQSASGVPYRTVDVSARNDDGTRKESTYLDLSGKPKKTTGDIMEGMGKVGTDSGPHSWEKKRINPYTGTSIG